MHVPVSPKKCCSPRATLPLVLNQTRTKSQSTFSRKFTFPAIFTLQPTNLTCPCLKCITIIIRFKSQQKFMKVFKRQTCCIKEGLVIPRVKKELERGLIPSRDTATRISSIPQPSLLYCEGLSKAGLLQVGPDKVSNRMLRKHDGKM